jgi:transposase
VVVLNPRAVREFAKCLGLLEKTDRIDAQVIARFAEVKKCEPSVPASGEQQSLKALSRRLQQLSRLAADQKNQRHLVSEPRVLRTFDAVLRVAKQQMREVEAEIATLWRAIRCGRSWKRRCARSKEWRDERWRECWRICRRSGRYRTKRCRS